MSGRRVTLVSATLTAAALLVGAWFEQRHDSTFLALAILMPGVLLNLFPSRLTWAALGYVPAVWATVFVWGLVDGAPLGRAWGESGYMLAQLVWMIPAGLILGLAPLGIRLLVRNAQERRAAGG